MKTLNALKLRIMTRAFKIRIAAGEVFEDIAADYPVWQRSWISSTPPTS